MPVLVRDFDTGQFVAVNRAFEEVVGYPSAEIIGRRPSDLYLLEPLADDERNLARVAGGGRVEAPIALRRKDGAIVDALFTATVADVAGRAYLIVVLYGVSPRRSSP